MEKLSIGVFDSGVGGLTVLKALRRLLPNEPLIYLGDTARVPYGNKSRETVVRYSMENAKFLVERGVKAIVVACNTSTACALPALQQSFAVPVLGVIEPGARKAVSASRKKRIGIIATSATVASGAYAQAIKGLDPAVQVISRACPLFVPLVEEGWIDTEATRLIVSHYLSPMRAEGIDVLILGCTHYPLLADVIADVMGESITLINSGEAVAHALCKELSFAGLEGSAGAGSIHLYVTDCSPQFVDLAKKILEGETCTLTAVAL